MSKLQKKVIAILLLAILFIVQFNFIAFIKPVNASTEDNENEVQMENNHYKYYYAQLSNNAKGIYNAMCEMYTNGDLKTGNTNYDLIAKGNISEDLVNAYKKGNNELIIAFETARDAFYLDYPEVFYVNMEKYSIRITNDAQGNAHVWLGTGNNESYYLHGFTSVDSVNEAELEYNTELNKIIDGARSFEAEYNDEELSVKQIEYVHSEIIKSATYKLDNECKEINKGHIRTPYGALVAKEAVCEGYSKAMKVAMDKLRIPCILVRGVYKSGSNDTERHMWNYVQLSGKWYAIDATFDDPDKINQIGEIDIYKDYFLAGDSKMSREHYPEGIMSAPEFEFAYPELEYDTYGVEEVANVNGLEIKYSSLPYEGNTLAVLDISYKGMNFADSAKAGYHFLTRYYHSENEPLDKWSYIDTTLYPSMIVDGENSFVMYLSTIPYMEIAVVDIPIDSRAYSSNLNESVYYQNFLGDESMFIASSGKLGLPDATYVAPPRFASASPYVDSKLKAGQTTHIKVTYDQDLVKTSDDVNPNCYITTKNAWTSSAEVNSTLSNFRWDGSRTVEFDFNPSSQYGDNSVIYYFNISGLVGKDTQKIPTPAHYYVQQTFGCSYSMAKANAWRVYGRPTLIDDGTTSVEGWKLSDGKTITHEDAENMKNITDKLALVVDRTTEAQNENMNNLIKEQTDSKILSSETYNINLILCNKKVLATANNDKVTVYLGFPEGYGPDDAGVTFKAYHFKTENGVATEVEEIPCVVTPYGLLVTCNSFSPFGVVAFESSPEDLADTSKTIAITSDENGTVMDLNDSLVTFNVGDTKQYTIQANEGYQIDCLTVLGNEIAEAVGKESYQIILNYNDIVDGNNIVNVTFVAKTVAQEESDRGETVVTPAVEPAVISDMQEKIVANIGGNVTIRPTITPSNGIDTYQWYKDGVELPGQTNPVLTINSINEENEGVYNLVVTCTVDAISQKVTSTDCKLLTSSFDMTLKTSETYVVPGEIFKIKVSLNNVRNINDGIVAILGQLEFDSSVLEIYKMENEDILSGENGWDLSAFNADNFKFIADNSTQITEDSDIFTVYFKVKDDITTEQEVSITVKNVTASEGNGVLSVSNATETINIVIEDITVDKYVVDDVTKIISRIPPNTTVAMFKENVTTKQTMVFTNESGVLLDTDIITTDTKLEVGKTLTYRLCVIGDIDKDGQISINDLAKLKLHLINKLELTGIYYAAADIDDDHEITVDDLSKMKLVLIDMLVIE